MIRDTMETTTLEDQQIAHILAEIEKQLGADFLLILTPSGNGNIALNCSQKQKTNVMFDKISHVITNTTTRH